MPRPLARAVSLCLLVFAARAAFAAPPVEYPDNEEEWFVVKFGDAACGFMHTQTLRLGDEIHTHVQTQLELARAAARIKITTNQTYRETLDGRPIGFSSETTMGQIPIVYTGVIKEGKLRLTSQQAGAKRRSTYDFDPEIRFPWGQYLEQRQRGLHPGTSFHMKTYEPTLRVDAPVELEIRVGEKETVDVLGKPQSLHKVTSTLLLEPPIPSESWVDDDAMPVVSTVDLGVAVVKMYRATREEAARATQAPEMFLATFVKAKGRVDRDAARTTYHLRVSRKNKRPLPDLPDTNMQTFRRINQYEGILTVRRIDWSAVRKAGADSTQAQPEFLRASTLVDTKDPRIRRLARRAVKYAKTPAEKADAIRKFVADHVEQKGLDIGFASASEVARNKSGDCTEHAVLLAALARAAGIPARGVSGVVLVPGTDPDSETPEFGYHMWTQVWIADRWVDVDAALRQTDCDTTHIALAAMHLNEEGPSSALTTLLSMLGRLEIEVVEIQ